MEKALKKCASGLDAKQRLLLAATQSSEDVLTYYHNSLDGYANHQVQEMRQLYGTNTIVQSKKDSIFKRLFDAFVNPFSLILIASSHTTIQPARMGKTYSIKPIASILNASVPVSCPNPYPNTAVIQMIPDRI